MSEMQAQSEAHVLGPSEGEHLIRNAGSILVKVDPRRDSKSLALGTQQVPVGTGIRVQQHHEADEVLFVLEGRGFGILGDTRIPVEKGSAIYVPRAAWQASRIATASCCSFGSRPRRDLNRSFGK